MLKELFRAKNYIVIAFASTHHALEAESLLEGKVEFIVMPTPREISASCGLALKIHPNDGAVVEKYLHNSNVREYHFYEIEKTGQESKISQLS